MFSTESLDNFQVNTGASSRQMKKVTNFLRSNAGKHSVPAYYNTTHVNENSKKLENVYQSGIFEFEVGQKTNVKEKRPVVWADSEELLQAVLKARNVNDGVEIKVMADGGQGFFKISMTVLPKNYSPELDCSINDSESDDDSNFPKKKRSTYAEGGSVGKDAKLTSVNKLIMLCIVPEIKESYENIEILFNLTNINNIPFKFVSDFKIILIVNGQQTATSMYPSPYCFVTLRHLRNNAESNNEETASNEENGSESGDIESSFLDSCDTGCMKLKTYGDLQTDYETFCSLGKNKKYAMQCHNTINAPLFNEDKDKYVIEKCLIPELHILQGFVNHMFWDGLVPLLGRENALIWPKK